MKKLLSVAFGLALLIIALTLLCTGCASESPSGSGDGVITAGTLPAITTQAIEQGTLFVRCSEPEDNRFSIQFVGVVPTNYVDYVGFEACIVYPDGTRGSRQTIKLTTLYRAIEDEEGNPVITSEDFGVEDGYLFARALERIPTDDEELAYEVASYYVVANKKYYTAKQTFAVKDLLEEHILADPDPFEHIESTELVEVQKWVRFTSSQTHKESNISKTYYLGASLPDANGNLKMYAVFAIPSININAVGLRYTFTQTEGDFAGVSTSIVRARTKTLYDKIITEDETLTIKDFGVEEGYLALIPFNQNVNILSREGYTLNLDLHFSRNAVETLIASEALDFTEVAKKCVLTRDGVPVSAYTYIPTGYHDWTWFGKDYSNANGIGKLRLRFTDAQNFMGEYTFSMQVAAAIPTRFSSRIAFVYTAYDKDGNIVGAPNYEAKVSAVYRDIFDNNDATMYPADFGYERGYIMSLVLNNMKYQNEKIDSIKLEAYYLDSGARVTVASLLIDLDDIYKLISTIE